jgi:vacuolar protein sorting-associated protein 16
VERPAWVGLSVADTLRGLVVSGENKRALQFKTDCKIPDMLFWYTKLRALAEAGDWAGLWTFANEKKSPVGYRPFVDACVSLGGRQGSLEARRYAAKIPEYEEKVDLLVTLGAFSDAAELAVKQKDGARLQFMLETGGSRLTPPAVELIEKGLAALGGARR